ncbi:MAG TPA: hypothetical protein VGD48_28300 [Kutzneria sp.]
MRCIPAGRRTSGPRCSAGRAATPAWRRRAAGTSGWCSPRSTCRRRPRTGSTSSWPADRSSTGPRSSGTRSGSAPSTLTLARATCRGWCWPIPRAMSSACSIPIPVTTPARSRRSSSRPTTPPRRGRAGLGKPIGRSRRGGTRSLPCGRRVASGWSCCGPSTPSRWGSGSDWDPLSLVVAVDAMPPIGYDLGAPGWAPTTQLSAYVRRLPAPGPIRIRVNATEIGGGQVDHVVRAWDSKDRLVVQATQICALRLPG